VPKSALDVRIRALTQKELAELELATDEALGRIEPERRLFRKLSTGEVIDPKWTRFTFPTMWQYDVLRGLDYLRRAGVEPEERVAEAVGLVEERRQPDGRWLLDASPRDAFDDDLEGGSGQPSRWNTLRALLVLEWYSALSDERGNHETSSYVSEL
jgi:hypothetical protein